MRHLLAAVVAQWAEAPGQRSRVVRVTSHAGHCADAMGVKLVGQVADRIGKLREDQHLLLRVLAGQQVDQRGQLGILCSLPGAAALKHTEEVVRVAA